MNLKSNVHQHIVATSCFEGQFRGIMSKQGIYSTYLDIPRPNSQRNFKPNGAVLNHFLLKKTYVYIYIYVLYIIMFLLSSASNKTTATTTRRKSIRFPTRTKWQNKLPMLVLGLGVRSVFSRLQKWMKRPSVPRRGHEGFLVLSSFLYQVLHVYRVDCEFWYICKAL